MADMRLVVTGAAGRMGRMLIKTITETPGVTLAAAFERSGSPALGQDAGLIAGVGAIGVPISDDPLAAMLDADGVIDFSAPAATVETGRARRPGAHRRMSSARPASPKPISPASPPRRATRRSCARAT